MSRRENKPLRRQDYRPPDYCVRTANLDFRIFDTHTELHSTLEIERDPHTSNPAPLVLNGEIAETQKVAINGVDLEPAEYQLESSAITLPNLPPSFTLETAVILRPKQNSTYKGLYYSQGTYLTDLEPTGFRKVTWFPDRPDVLARYRTRIEADRHACPAILANGNRIDSGELPRDRHWVVWEDPFPKPCYLFAMVAGDLRKYSDVFTTASGRQIILEIWVAEQDLTRCGHAMESLKRAMRWDEQRFGREYDLDTYMIVAVRDFNGGAMENKGLNIFNSKYVLADPATATDDDYESIDGCVAHEYFHNWTGNRVTLRSWFELTLKEGLTVFRDQKYGEEVVAGPVKRLMSVRNLKNNQFPQDASALVHAIRPEEAVEFLNLYTTTVYDKGAEVVRMCETLLGSDGFRQGMDLYFDRHDGQAVACDDFLSAMADANGKDLSSFAKWYEQSGTPVVKASGSWDAARQTFELHLRQSLPAGCLDPGPLLIPVRLAFLGLDGQLISAHGPDEDHTEEPKRETVLWLRQSEQQFKFKNINKPVVPSLLRGFSAPVRIDYDYPADQLALLIACDTDPISRWDAAQRLATQTIHQVLDQKPETELGILVDAFRQLAEDESVDLATRAFILELPQPSFLASGLGKLDPLALSAARRQVERAIGQALGDQFRSVYERLTIKGPYRYDRGSVGRRRLRNRLLNYLCAGFPEEGATYAHTQFASANNMTDELAALRCLVDIPGAQSKLAIDTFYRKWQHSPLVIDKWFAAQAAAQTDDVFERVQQLSDHPAFERANPNRFTSLLQTFSQHNLSGFHRRDGSAYHFLVKELLDIDAQNAQMSAKLVQAWRSWFRFAEPWRTLQKEALLCLAEKKLATNANEHVERILEAESNGHV